MHLPNIFISNPDLWCTLTFKQRADLPPAHDASLTGVLAECGLQNEQRNPARHEEKGVRNEERTCKEKHGKTRIFIDQIFIHIIYLEAEVSQMQHNKSLLFENESINNQD